MSVAVHVFDIDKISQLSLEELINNNQNIDNFYCKVNKQSIELDNRCLVEVDAYESNNTALLAEKSADELILFSDLTIKQLFALLKATSIEVNALVAINQRANKTSYRFNVSTIDLNKAKTALANFCLEHDMEAALINDAPYLSTPGVLVMDMDSTTIEIECIDEIAKLAGVGEEVAAVTELAMQGELDFAQSLHQRVATLEGSPASILASVADNIPLMPGLSNLVVELKKQDWKVAIASGGFTYFADHLKDLLSLDAAFANKLEIIDGKLTGKVLGDVVDAQVKADVLLQLQQSHNLDKTQTVAMGDGANDLVMMSAAHLGVAFHAKPIVLKQADCAINNSGLDLMLHWLK